MKGNLERKIFNQLVDFQSMFGMKIMAWNPLIYSIPFSFLLVFIWILKSEKCFHILFSFHLNAFISVFTPFKQTIRMKNMKLFSTVYENGVKTKMKTTVESIMMEILLEHFIEKIC